MIWSETNIILAIIGMVGLFSTAIIWQRANRITSRYYRANKINHDLIALNNEGWYKDMDTHKGIGLGNVYIGSTYVE